MASYSTGYYSAIEFGEPITFMAGFNIFSSSVDGAPDVSDHGNLISITLIDTSQAITRLVSVATFMLVALAI